MADIEATGAVELSKNDVVDLEMNKDEDAVKGLKRKLEETTAAAAEEPKLNGSSEGESNGSSTNGHEEIEGDKKNGHTNGSSLPKESPVKKAKTDEDDTKGEDLSITATSTSCEEKTELIEENKTEEKVIDEEMKDIEAPIIAGGGDAEMKDDVVDAAIAEVAAPAAIPDPAITEDKVDSAEKTDLPAEIAPILEAEEKSE